MTTTTNSIHGHEILHLLADQGPLSRASLTQIAETRFGKNAIYHTCSASGMDLDALLVFLLDRVKIQEGPQGLAMHGEAHICENE